MGSVAVSAHVAGAGYVEAMERDPADREYRRAFLELALTRVAPGGRIFDFGCGPGIDARHYAAAGLRVGAYDVDPAMREYFSAHCAEEIRTGAIRVQTGDYADFLRAARIEGGDGVDLIVANFAPLNLIDEPRALFARFVTMLNPKGSLLLSVLNPWFHLLRESRRRWLRLPQLLVRGRYDTRLHGVTPVTRWLPRQLAREAAPHFALTAAYAPDTRGVTPARRVSSILRQPAALTATQFLFLQFERGAR
jgi:SAM-dependent methyltransferase